MAKIKYIIYFYLSFIKLIINTFVYRVFFLLKNLFFWFIMLLLFFYFLGNIFKEYIYIVSCDLYEYYLSFCKILQKKTKKIKRKLFFYFKKFKILFNVFASWYNLKEYMLEIYNMFCNAWTRLKKRFNQYQYDYSLIYYDFNDCLYRIFYMYVDLGQIALSMGANYYIKGWCAHTCFILPRILYQNFMYFILEHKEIFLNIWNNPIVLGILLILASYFVICLIASKFILSFLTSLLFLSHIHTTGEGFIVFYDFKDFQTTLDDWIMVSPENLEMIKCNIDWDWLRTKINLEKVTHFVINESNIDENYYSKILDLQYKIYNNIMDDLTETELKGFKQEKEQDLIFNNMGYIRLNNFYFNQMNLQYLKKLNIISSDNNNLEEYIKIISNDCVYKALNDNLNWMKMGHFVSSFSPVININMLYILGSATFLIILQLSPQLREYVINFPQEHPEIFIEMLKGIFHYGVYYAVTCISSYF